jgi:hypothetical protein
MVNQTPMGARTMALNCLLWRAAMLTTCSEAAGYLNGTKNPSLNPSKRRMPKRSLHMTMTAKGLH